MPCFLRPDNPVMQKYKLDVALGNITTIVYDEALRKETRTNPLSGVSVTTFDERGNITHSVNPIGTEWFAEYDANNNMLSQTDGLGRRTTYAYDAAGNWTSSTNVRGDVTSMTYDAGNLPLARTDALGRRRTSSYDAKGNITALSDAAGNVYRVTTDDYGRPLTVVDPLGHLTRLEYAAPDLATGVLPTMPSRVIYPNNTSISYTYDALGNVTSFTNVSGQTSYSVYDDSGMLLESIDPLGYKTKYAYNERGELASITNALGQISTYEYDLAGRLLRHTGPNGAVTSRTWDKLGRPVAVTDPLNRTSTSFYRADGAVEKVRQPDGAEIRFEYDILGNCTAVIDPAGNRTAYTYNNLYQVINRIDPLGHSTTSAYDKIGNLTSFTDRLGRVTTYTYDVKDFLTREQWLGAGTGEVVKEIVYQYDVLGNTLAAGDDVSAFSYTYDNRNRVLTSTALYPTLPNAPPAFTLTNTFNDTGRIYGTVASDGASVESRYDERNLLASLRWTGAADNPSGARLDYVRDALGAVITTTRYNGVGAPANAPAVTTVYGYIPSGGVGAQRLTRITHTGSGGTGQVLADYLYTHDIAGQLKTTTSAATGDTTTLTHDLTGQLTTAEYRFQTQHTEQFTYDTAGNRTTSATGPLLPTPPPATPYTTGPGNRLLSDGQHTYTYDNEGNTILRRHTLTEATTAYTYDHRNRLTELTDKDAAGTPTQTVAFTYDLFDRRIAKTVTSDATGNTPATTTFTYRGHNIWRENDPSGTPTWYLTTNAVDSWQARQRPTDAPTNPGLAWYLKDRLGSITDIATADGSALLNHTEYTQFGEVRSHTNPTAADRLTFTGREFDTETGLHYYRARYYDARIGKFTSEDPIGFAAWDYNISRYVGNGPASGTDPFGLSNAGLAPALPPPKPLPPQTPPPHSPKGRPGSGPVLETAAILAVGTTIIASVAYTFNENFRDAVNSVIPWMNDAGPAPTPAPAPAPSPAPPAPAPPAPAPPAPDPPAPDPPAPANPPIAPEDLQRMKGDSWKSTHDALQQLEEIEKAQKRLKKAQRDATIESTKKSEQRGKNALKPHNWQPDDD
ncbi:hypothetical protein DB346_13675 [Verrucomicrobia bacterium LW23]|nr:hypothetical protein DB346_13675 [Verrucomicrobia bacterium LW23]